MVINHCLLLLNCHLLEMHRLHFLLSKIKFWTAEEKKTQKIDHLARSLLIQGLLNDIYSLIDSNKTAKDLWDVLERQMRGSKYGEQDRKAVILYKYETFKATEGEQLLDTYIRHLQVINDFKKCGYKKDNCELNYKFLNNLQPEWKQYGTLMRQTKNLMDINIDALYNILKQNQGDVNDALRYKKKAIVVTSDLLELVTKKTKVSKRKEKVVVSLNSKGSGADDFSELKKITALLAKAFNRRKFYSKPTNNNLRTSSTSHSEGHFAKDCKKAKVKDYNYYKTKMLLAKKDSDEQVLLVEDQAWMDSSSDSDQEINANMVFMAQIEKVVGLGFTLMFLIHSDEALEIEKFKRARENKMEFAYDYVNLNASYVNEKIKFSDNYFQEIINLDFEKIDSPFQQTSSLKPYVPNVILEKIIIDLEDEVKKKWSSNISNVDLSSVSVSKLNKNVKRYSRKDLLSCNNSHLRETSIAYVYNDAMNVSCNSRMCDLFDENNLFIFDDESVRISPVSKMPFMKNPRDSMNIIDSGCSKHMMGNRALLTNFVEKFLGTVRFGNNDFAMIAGVGQFCDKVLEVAFRKSTCFVRNEDGVDLLTGLPKMKFKKGHLCSACDQGKIHWKHHKSKTDFASIKPLYLLHMDLCGPMHVEKFKNKTLAKLFDEVGITQQLSAARMPQQNGVVERRNRTLVEAARTMFTFENLPLFLWVEAIATACFTQNRSIIHKSFDKTPYELMNKRKPNIKFFCVFECRCYLLIDYKDVGKLKEKRDIGVFVGYSKESAVFRIYDKQTRKIHESVNVNFNEISEMASKQFSLEPGLSNLNKTGKYSNPSISQVSKTSKKDLEDLFQNFYDEYSGASKIMKSLTTNVETSINEEVFHEVSDSFQGESSSSSLNDDVQQSPKEVILPQTSIQSISNNMIPNVDEASTSHNVFNKHLEDAYFDASTSFHNPSNVYTFYQPYPHEKKWTKDHPLHKIIDLKDTDWVSAMQDELDQFVRLKV
uniref:Integrase catalytic domain-containing protein n=1 Tax=Tanacetum cinerariifolium TaxID=118510 RepID=A0A699IHI6_TANCI|nr:hypothetical protein [Tanacetum cinerariifolium]